ncbi:hypothetical protein SAMN05216553_104305 [Lentzea fradiae]|uniref:Ricin B lectin domain-containing protein n=1 Tax=Lentzea fradiae TaxID=200378 RepID=A0A1G7Q7C4_9PSEU|nr:XRE family transcriptional regulator [Lentzea fradiae]SDF94416.1 hypothetical protein SAMN05216553_104305 [Lentzea fradiae]
MDHGGGGSAGPPVDAPRPQARTPSEFTAELRALRTWSGLTYRQIEGKASAHATRFPASTIATTLGRATLPKEWFVEVFTRACGLGDEEVRQWLDVRRRIATENPVQTGDQDGDDRDEAADEGLPPRSPRWRRAASLLAATGIGVAGTLGVTSVVGTSAPPPPPSAQPVTGLAVRAVGSWARIHPGRTPELCLTEGRDRTGRYATAVAAQQVCADAVLPRVFVEPLGDDVVQIQWHHPEYGIGCLTVLLDGPGRDLLEPRDDCAGDNTAQQFRVEPHGPSAAGRFRIRPVVTDQCLSLRDQDTEAGAEVVQGRCSGAADQEFSIELVSPP